jgi:hypothetical protein
MQKMSLNIGASNREAGASGLLTILRDPAKWFATCRINGPNRPNDGSSNEKQGDLAAEITSFLIASGTSGEDEPISGVGVQSRQHFLKPAARDESSALEENEGFGTAGSHQSIETGGGPFPRNRAHLKYVRKGAQLQPCDLVGSIGQK